MNHEITMKGGFDKYIFICSIYKQFKTPYA